MYRRRCIDNEIKLLLSIKGAVNIVGVKWCGKTTTAKYHSKSQIFLQNTQERQLNQLLINNEIKAFLEKEPPLLLDEWQEFPLLWDAVRFEVDQRQERGQFILTGSTSLPSKSKEQIRHSGIGRISTIEMLPMSLYEFGESSGTVSLTDLFEGKQNFSQIVNNISISQMAQLICRGGWPESISLQGTASLKISKDYYKSLINIDVSKYDGVTRSPNLCNLILNSIARNISTSVTISTIISDVKNNHSATKETIESYIDVLNQLFVLKNVESWNYNLRSSSAIRRTKTKYFVDPSIAAVALRVTPNKLLNDFQAFGLFFENLCVRDLIIYSNCIDGKIFKYQDRYGLEIDSIIELQDGRWGAFEIKLGEMEFEKAAANLLKLNSLMIKNKNRPASFLAILTGTKYGYKRDDGVMVIPIGCLKD